MLVEGEAGVDSVGELVGDDFQAVAGLHLVGVHQEDLVQEVGEAVHLSEAEGEPAITLRHITRPLLSY